MIISSTLYNDSYFVFFTFFPNTAVLNRPCNTDKNTEWRYIFVTWFYKKRYSNLASNLANIKLTTGGSSSLNHVANYSYQILQHFFFWKIILMYFTVGNICIKATSKNHTYFFFISTGIFWLEITHCETFLRAFYFILLFVRF